MPPATTDQEKQRLRLEARRRRDSLFSAFGSLAAEAAAQAFMERLPLPEGAIVSGYWPMRSEFDCRPLLLRLAESGMTLCLPVVVARDKPLRFRQWRPGDTLEAASFGIQEPTATAPQLQPDVLLVPLLAYDDEGYRLGYGGGYYDRTLSDLRRRGQSCLAVGLAFDDQRMPELPRHGGDARLDWLVTERRVRQFRHDQDGH